MRPAKWTWKNVEMEGDLLDALALRFEAGLIEAALSGLAWNRTEAQQLELLAHLGDLYGRLGDLRKGLEVDKRLVRIRPDEPIFHYNLACTHSRLGHVDSAFEALREAIRLGYQNFEHLRADRDLDNLKKDARFRRLLQQMDKSL
ncbi:MAG: hypothetical protein O7J95_07700 [Planctomycetota bacterium]|nr:hypothetical protein [Planctomycetota bacterium]